MCQRHSTEEEDSKNSQNHHIIDRPQDNVCFAVPQKYLRKVPQYCSHHVTFDTITSNLVQ